MQYLYLILAIILEVVGSSYMKISDGFSKALPTAITLGAYAACFYFFALALKSISLGAAYALWAGMGIVLTATVSVVVFKSALDLPAVICIVLILSGVVVLSIFSETVH